MTSQPAPQPYPHTAAPIIAHPATPKGRLAGFETVCYDCGLRMSSTILTNLQADVREHQAYMMSPRRASR